MECDDKLISEVDIMIEEVKSPSTVDFSTISNTEEAASVEQEEAGDENDIAEKSLVYLIGDPSVKGIVRNIRIRFPLYRHIHWFSIQTIFQR